MLFLLWIIQRQTYSPVLLVLPGQSITVSHENKRRQKTVKTCLLVKLTIEILAFKTSLNTHMLTHRHHCLNNLTFFLEITPLNCSSLTR